MSTCFFFCPLSICIIWLSASLDGHIPKDIFLSATVSHQAYLPHLECKKKKKLHASEPHKANTTTHLPAIKILRPPFYNNVFDVMSGDAMIIPYRALLI